MNNKKVLIAILARDKEATLPLYLECIRNLDYDKKNIVLYIRTNNNSDNTEQILVDYINIYGSLYSDIHFDNSNVDINLTTHHDWNVDRFKVLGAIRNESLNRTLFYECDYYFVVDCDNFILPHTLKSLMKFDVPIIAPFLVTDQSNYYSNFHYDVDANGYFANNEHYFHIFSRSIKGIFQVKVVHCTYLIKSDVINYLNYDDNSSRYEYVIFSDSARKNNIPQYIDNTEMYGLITFKTKTEEMNGLNFNTIKDFINLYNIYK